MWYNDEALKELALHLYEVEGLNVIMDMGTFGGRQVYYTAKDQNDLDQWLIESGRLMKEKYEVNFAEG